MTPSDTDGLVERLREKAAGKRNRVGDLWGEWIVNEAADAIQAQAARIAELERALERLTFDCGDYGHMTFAEIIAEAAKYPGERIDAEIAVRQALGRVG